jgi:hypothetical protein
MFVELDDISVNYIREDVNKLAVLILVTNSSPEAA